MSDESIKVTDKRMFTPDGQLREEYRFLEDRTNRSPQEGPQETAASPEAAPDRPAPPDAGPGGGEPAAELAADSSRPVADFPDAGAEGPGFFDLLGVLAEPVPFYLGDTALPTGETQENPEAARFYIDLIEVLRQKTAGNLSPQESGALEDVLYRLRVRYVQKHR